VGICSTEALVEFRSSERCKSGRFVLAINMSLQTEWDRELATVKSEPDSSVIQL
jgi:hypothetical protein